MKINIAILLSLVVLLNMAENYRPVASGVNYFSGRTAAESSCTDPEDTIRYLREQIVEKKENYIGKELNVLMNDLSIQPLFSLYNVGGLDENMDYKISTSLYLHYFKGYETEKRLRGRITGGILKVYWQTPYEIDSVVNFNRKNGRGWNKAAADFYGNRIIKDITVY